MAEKITLIARHQIIRDGADKKREVIDPNTAFHASNAEEAEELTKSGAARLPTEGEAKLAAGKLVPDVAAKGNPNSNQTEKKALADMSHAELKEEAASRNLSFAGNVSKADLLKQLQEDDKAKALV